MKMHPLYKTLLLLAVVFGPFFWLVFSGDGQRRVDIVLISLLEGGEPLDIAFGKLRSSAREADFRANFPEVEFQCADQTTAFGERVCSSRILSFNGAPAKSVSVFFHRDRLNAVQLIYQPAHHDYVVQRLRLELGEPVAEQAGGTVLNRWTNESGSVFLPATEPESLSEASIMWLSGEQARRSADAGGDPAAVAVPNGG